MRLKVKFAMLCVVLIFSEREISAQIDTLPSVKGLDEAEKSLGVTDAEMIDLLMPVMPGIGSTSNTLLTEQSVKPYMMPPRKMGKLGKTTAYALAAAMEYYFNFNQNFKDNLSPDYISLSAGSDAIDDAFKFLNLNGTVSAAIMPYDASAISTGVYATQKYKISNYLHIFRETTPGRQKTFELRKALMRGNPVILDLLVTPDFTGLKNVRSWRALGAKPSVPIMVLAVSYDQDIEAFEVYGFWGQEWGINGYLWLDYTEVEKYAQNAYVLLPAGQ